MNVSEKEIFEFLQQKAHQYNHPDFIEQDPIQIPHLFSKKQDIEISGLLTATISWGNRKSIINSSQKMMDFMDRNPYEFIMHSSEKELNVLMNKNIHRTFNGEDFLFFLVQLKKLYREHDSLESLFLLQEGEHNYYHAIERFRNMMLKDYEHRCKKHISSPYKNSASKRLMMYLRWMIRKDNTGVDFGIWENSHPKNLSIPLDVHTANISRKLGILKRKQNDWKAVEELDNIIRKYEKQDPAILDFALFGLGINNEF